MPARIPDTPQQLLDRFIGAGWTVVDEGTFNWLVAFIDADGESGAPFVIPKDGGEIGLEVMNQAHERLKSAARANLKASP